MRRAWPVLGLLALAGCGAGTPFFHPANGLLARADRLAAAGDLAGAREAYDAVIARYPDTGAAAQAGARRGVVDQVLAARADLERLRAEADRLRSALVAREREVGQLRQALAGHEAELGRLRRELAAREAELEQLKRTEIRRFQRGHR